MTPQSFAIGFLELKDLGNGTEEIVQKQNKHDIKEET